MKKKVVILSLILSVPLLMSGQWVFNSFDGNPYWGDQVDPYDDLETRAIITYVSDPLKVGEAALQIDWGVTNNQSWGGASALPCFHWDSLGVYDFSGYDSLMFWYYNESPSSLPGKMHFRLNLCDVSDSPNGFNTYNSAETEYWYSFHYILDDESGWKKISIPLSDVREDPNGFDRKGWWGIDGNDQLDLDMIKGFQMEFVISATEGDVASGTIVLDNMILTSTTGDTMVFNSFDGDPYWGDQVDPYDDLETRAIITYVSDPLLFGSGAMRVDWGATHDQDWGGGCYLPHLNLDSLEVYDFSGYDSLAFWYYVESKSTQSEKVHLRFNLCDVSDSPDGNKTYDIGQTEYWYTFNYILDDDPGWNKLAFPLVDVRDDPNSQGFERTGWFGIEGNDQLDLDMIKGFQMEFSIEATLGDVAQGTIIFDNLILYSGELTAVKELKFNQPVSYKLTQNYPNPFNAVTTISYSIGEPDIVKLTVLDILGREIKTLVNEHKPAGDYIINLEANDLSSGTYFYRLITGDFNQVRKMILVK